jgi:predicted nucleotidyltransferase
VSKLKALREAAGVTQAELAALSGVAQPNIAAYESGGRMLSRTMLERLTSALVRPSELVEKHREAIREVVKANRASEPRVFGSVARGADHPGSDLDLLVTMGDDASLFDLARLHLELEDLLGIRVDVLDERGLKAKHRQILDDVVPL